MVKCLLSHKEGVERVVSYLFAFPASRALHEDFVALATVYANPTLLPRQAQAPMVVQLTQRYSDEIVAALVLNLAQGGSSDASSSSLLETVANVIKSTVHALIRQVIGKLDNQELIPVAAYIASRRTQLERDGKVIDYISFRLAANDYQLLHSAWSNAANGIIDRPAVTAAMLRFAELSVKAFYEESAHAVKLGFIARNMFSVGQMAISKGSKTAINRLIPSLRERDLKDFAGYFLTMLVDNTAVN